MKKKTRKILAPILSVVVCALGILAGYMIGSRINTTYFVSNKYANLSADELRDDITKLNYESKTPDQLTPAEVFQVCAYNLEHSEYYCAIGTGTLSTSLGVDQSMYTYDEKDGNTVNLRLLSSSSYMTVVRRATFEIGGDIRMQHGKAKDTNIDNVEWIDKYDEFTWEGYKDEFGKYANINSSLLVTNKTVLSQTFDGKEGNLYTFSVELDPTLGTVIYAKQIAANLGIEPSAVNFTRILITFTVDDQFRIHTQYKTEEYTVPMFGMTIGLVGTIVNETVYEK